VIRGQLAGRSFKGEVLLKVNPSGPEQCREVSAYWAPVELHLADDDKLYGAWLQTYVDSTHGCKVVGEKWQIYGLERLNVN
jgi:hypothetical protein